MQSKALNFDLCLCVCVRPCVHACKCFLIVRVEHIMWFRREAKNIYSGEHWYPYRTNCYIGNIYQTRVYGVLRRHAGHKVPCLLIFPMIYFPSVCLANSVIVPKNRPCLLFNLLQFIIHNHQFVQCNTKQHFDVLQAHQNPTWKPTTTCK